MPPTFCMHEQMSSGSRSLWLHSRSSQMTSLPTREMVVDKASDLVSGCELNHLPMNDGSKRLQASALSTMPRICMKSSEGRESSEQKQTLPDSARLYEGTSKAIPSCTSNCNIDHQQLGMSEASAPIIHLAWLQLSSSHSPSTPSTIPTGPSPGGGCDSCMWVDSLRGRCL